MHTLPEGNGYEGIYKPHSRISKGVHVPATEVRARIKDARNKVGLELVQINIETTVEAQGRRDARHNLGDDAVQVCIARRNESEVFLADVVDGFVINLVKSKS